jgi:hypothetical protein
MWYTCSLYEGSNDRGKLLFQKKIQIKAGKEGINHINVERKFVNRYTQYLQPGYLLITDNDGSGVGLLYTGPFRYWYLKYKGKPIKMGKDGGFSIGEWEGWMCGITDITRFPQKRYALANLKILRHFRTEDAKRDFTLVKVKVR